MAQAFLALVMDGGFPIVKWYIMYCIRCWVSIGSVQSKTEKQNFVLEAARIPYLSCLWPRVKIEQGEIVSS